MINSGQTLKDRWQEWRLIGCTIHLFPTLTTTNTGVFYQDTITAGAQRFSGYKIGWVWDRQQAYGTIATVGTSFEDILMKTGGQFLASANRYQNDWVIKTHIRATAHDRDMWLDTSAAPDASPNQGAFFCP